MNVLRYTKESRLIRNMIILVSGYRRAGKDFFATHGPVYYNIYSRNYSRDALRDVTRYKRLKFATPLAQLVPLYFNISPEEYDALKDDPSAIEDNGTVRDYLIAIAKSVRDLDSDFFVRRTAYDVKLAHDEGRDVVITDWRYPNEYEFLQKMFPGQILTVRISREYDENGKPLPIPDSSIISEHALDDFMFDFYLSS